MNFEDETLAVAQKGKKKGPSPKAASARAGVAARRKEKSLSESLPSLKLKIPIASAEESEAADLLNLSAPADSGLKLVVSNGKIIRYVCYEIIATFRVCKLVVGWNLLADLMFTTTYTKDFAVNWSYEFKS